MTGPDLPIPLPIPAPLDIPNVLDFVELLGQSAYCQHNELPM